MRLPHAPLGHRLPVLRITGVAEPPVDETFKMEGRVVADSEILENLERERLKVRIRRTRNEAV